MEINGDYIDRSRKKLLDRYLLKIRETIANEKYEDAEELLSLFIEMFPDNEEGLKIYADFSKKLTEIGKQDVLNRLEVKEPIEEYNGKKTLRIKNITFNFIKKYYPDEIDMFDLVWRLFKDISLQDLKKETFSEALGIVGSNQTSDKITPKVIITLNELSGKIYKLDQEEIKMEVKTIGHKLGCSPEVIERIGEFISFKAKK